MRALGPPTIWGGLLKAGYGGDGEGMLYHYCDIFVVDAVVVNRWFEEMGVLFEPCVVSLLDGFPLD